MDASGRRERERKKEVFDYAERQKCVLFFSWFIFQNMKINKINVLQSKVTERCTEFPYFQSNSGFFPFFSLNCF